MPSTAASSSRASMARSSNRATSVRNARPARSSGPIRACHSVSYGLERRGVGAVVAQRRRQHFRGIASAQQAVVDAAAGRRLGEPGCVADRHDAVRVGALHRCRAAAPCRRGLAPRAAPVALARDGGVYAVNRLAAASVAINPTRAIPMSPRRERHHPREPARRQAPVQIDLDVVHARKRHLELRALQICARNAEAELTVEAVLRAAGEHAHAAANRVLAIADRHAGGDAAAHVERRHTGAAQDRRAGGGRPLGERPIEAAAIDDRRGHVAAVDADAAAVAAVEPSPCG